ncbi:hypothetical protein JD844_007853 [Phrynosoma platyrhinos]|uniref:Mig-6 domain-containing protein n=1 Tax=Phrynosoma platyrhinos TaxID=52577 RepID=A0ABQ7T3F1_PHRPL|nr:hypothetical protein JD844_007853 [Phrynosoma platyrhinos]
MDPPDVLGVDLNAARPTQLPGRTKRERPPRPPQPLILLKKPSYDPVSEEDNPLSVGLKHLCLKKKPGPQRGLRPPKPSACVSGTRAGERLLLPHARGGVQPGSEVTLIDFEDEPVPTTPSPIGELCAPSLAKLAMEAFSLLDKTPPQSPTQGLPRPLHPTPVVDWDARPLPPPPTYDDVAQDEDDFEVCSINSAEGLVGQRRGRKSWENGETNCSFVPEGDRPSLPLEDNLFLPPKETKQPSPAQTTEIFQELQQECMKHLNVPLGANPVASMPSPGEDKPQIPPRVPILPRPLRRNEHGRWSGELSPASGGEEDRPPQIPPRDPLSQPSSRTPSPRALQGGSPQPRANLCSPLSLGSFLSTSPGKQPMPTTQSFALDPKYATPKVIQAQGKECTKGPCILPIVKDGRKVSSTHYYLLPERPPYLDKYEKFFKEAKNPEEAPAPARVVTTATVRPMIQPQPDCRANFSSNNSNIAFKATCGLQKIIYDGSDSPGDSAWRHDRGVPGSFAEPQLERTKGRPVPEGGAALLSRPQDTAGVPEGSGDVRVEPGAGQLSSAGPLRRFSAQGEESVTRGANGSLELTRTMTNDCSLKLKRLAHSGLPWLGLSSRPSSSRPLDRELSPKPGAMEQRQTVPVARERRCEMLGQTRMR